MPWESARSLPFQQRFGGAHIFVLVVDAYHDHVFGLAIFVRFDIGFEIVVFDFRIGDLTDGFNVLPFSCVDRILGALDGRKSIFRTETNVNLRAFDRGREVFDTRRGGVDFEAAALLGGG